MRVSFLHIGMMKTGSSYMQSAWSKSHDYAVQWGNNKKYLTDMRKNIEKNNIVDIGFSISPEQKYDNKDIVISSEGFSTAFLNYESMQKRIPDFLDYASYQLSSISSYTQNLLIVIRDPISWISSMHIQSLKEGGTGNAQKFVEEQKDFILHSLNLKYMVECYQRFFSNILILPYEVLNEDVDTFWGVISQSFDCPVMKVRKGFKANVSPSLKRSYLISFLNSEQDIVSRNIMRHSGEDARIGKLIPTYLESGKWINRWVAERSTDEEIESMYRDLGLKEVPKDFLDFNLEKEVKDSIRDNYIGYLFDNIMREFPESYLSRLETSQFN